MISLIVDGNEENCGIGGADSFEKLIERVRDDYNRDSQVIHSVFVDGEELTDSLEKLYSNKPISDFGKLEVKTLSKIEMSVQMLAGVVSLLDEMIQLSERIAEEQSRLEVFRQFTRLIDGLQVFIDTVQTVRLACRVINTQSLALMEADLLSVMKDMVMYCNENKIEYMQSILRNDLPIVLRDWADSGIPEIEAIITKKSVE